MKLLILFFLLNPIICLAQSFEGTIMYFNSYKSKSPKVNDEQLNSLMGTKQIYYIKGAEYKSVFNGSFVKMQLYKSIENRGYTLTAKSDSLYWENYGQNKDIAIKYEIQENKDTVMGVICDLLIIHTPKSRTLYYYNKNYAINPELFIKHQFGNWYYIISKTKALPLETIYEDDLYIYKSTAK